MASGGGGCSASGRLPPPFPGLDPESEGAAGGSEPEAGDSDTEGEDIFTGAAAAVSSYPAGQQAVRRPKEKSG
jgi:sorting nexin-1/2